MKTLLLIVLLGLAVSTNAVLAVTLCVTNGAELNFALLLADSNGQADEIRLAIGNYDVPAGGFRFESIEDRDITLSGGWSDFFGNPCGQRFDSTNAYQTALQGNGVDQVMSMSVPANSSMNVTIERLLFINGNTSSNGGGLEFFSQDSATGRLVVEKCAFVANQADFGAALFAYAPGSLYIKNSVFVGNHSSAFGVLSGTVFVTTSGADFGIQMINNTIIGNTTNGQVSGIYAVANTPAGLNLINNNTWNNAGFDVALFGSGARFFTNNNYATATGLPASATGNISVLPVYVGGFFDYTPAPGSPLRDAGRNSPFTTPFPPTLQGSWSTGTQDIFGNDRRRGSRTDIGAHEAEPEDIFDDGFE